MVSVVTVLAEAGLASVVSKVLRDERVAERRSKL